MLSYLTTTVNEIRFLANSHQFQWQQCAVLPISSLLQQRLLRRVR
jgi:hypothetical protein